MCANSAFPTSQLRRDQDPQAKFVFTSERGAPFTTDALNRHIKRLGANPPRLIFGKLLGNVLAHRDKELSQKGKTFDVKTEF